MKTNKRRWSCWAKWPWNMDTTNKHDTDRFLNFQVYGIGKTIASERNSIAEAQCACVSGVSKGTGNFIMQKDQKKSISIKCCSSFYSWVIPRLKVSEKDRPMKWLNISLLITSNGVQHWQNRNLFKPGWYFRNKTPKPWHWSSFNHKGTNANLINTFFLWTSCKKIK